MPGGSEERALKAIAKLGAQSRLTTAKARIEKAIDHIRGLIEMHEANAVVLYSPVLADQIPRSYAARAFNQFQRSMYSFELVRLAALWDGVGENRESIPTIVALLDHPDVIDLVVEAIRQSHLNDAAPVHLNGEDDPEAAGWWEAYWAEDRIRTADEQAATVRADLDDVFGRVAELQASDVLQRLRWVRNNVLAHNLERREGAVQAEAADRWTYGGEADLLETAIEIALKLYYALTPRSWFDLKDVRAQARRNANDLWGSCTFAFERRR